MTLTEQLHDHDGIKVSLVWEKHTGWWYHTSTDGEAEHRHGPYWNKSECRRNANRWIKRNATPTKETP